MSNVGCVLCNVGCVLCNVGCVLCNVGCVLCNIVYVLCNIGYVLCNIETLKTCVTEDCLSQYSQKQDEAITHQLFTDTNNQHQMPMDVDKQYQLPMDVDNQLDINDQLQLSMDEDDQLQLPMNANNKRQFSINVGDQCQLLMGTVIQSVSNELAQDKVQQCTELQKQAKCIILAEDNEAYLASLEDINMLPMQNNRFLLDGCRNSNNTRNLSLLDDSSGQVFNNYSNSLLCDDVTYSSLYDDNNNPSYDCTYNLLRDNTGLLCIDNADKADVHNKLIAQPLRTQKQNTNCVPSAEDNEAYLTSLEASCAVLVPNNSLLVDRSNNANKSSNISLLQDENTSCLLCLSHDKCNLLNDNNTNSTDVLFSFSTGSQETVQQMRPRKQNTKSVPSAEDNEAYLASLEENFMDQLMQSNSSSTLKPHFCAEHTTLLPMRCEKQDVKCVPSAEDNEAYITSLEECGIIYAQKNSCLLLNTSTSDNNSNISLLCGVDTSRNTASHYVAEQAQETKQQYMNIQKQDVTYVPSVEDNDAYLASLKDSCMVHDMLHTTNSGYHVSNVQMMCKQSSVKYSLSHETNVNGSTRKLLRTKSDDGVKNNNEVEVNEKNSCDKKDATSAVKSVVHHVTYRDRRHSSQLSSPLLTTSTPAAWSLLTTATSTPETCSLLTTLTSSPTACSLLKTSTSSPAACSLLITSTPTTATCSLLSKATLTPATCSLLMTSTSSPAVCSLLTTSTPAACSLLTTSTSLLTTPISFLPGLALVLAGQNSITEQFAMENYQGDEQFKTDLCRPELNEDPLVTDKAEIKETIFGSKACVKEMNVESSAKIATAYELHQARILSSTKCHKKPTVEISTAFPFESKEVTVSNVTKEIPFNNITQQFEMIKSQGAEQFKAKLCLSESNEDPSVSEKIGIKITSFRSKACIKAVNAERSTKIATAYEVHQARLLPSKRCQEKPIVETRKVFPFKIKKVMSRQDFEKLDVDYISQKNKNVCETKFQKTVSDVTEEIPLNTLKQMPLNTSKEIPLNMPNKTPLNKLVFESSPKKGNGLEASENSGTTLRDALLPSGIKRRLVDDHAEIQPEEPQSKSDVLLKSKILYKAQMLYQSKMLLQSKMLYQSNVIDNNNNNVLYQSNESDNDNNVLYQSNANVNDNYVLYQSDASDNNNYVLYQSNASDNDNNVSYQSYASDNDNNVLYQSSASDNGNNVSYQYNASNNGNNVLYQSSVSDNDNSVLYQSNASDNGNNVLYHSSASDNDNNVLYQFVTNCSNQRQVSHGSLDVQSFTHYNTPFCQTSACYNMPSQLVGLASHHRPSQTPAAMQATRIDVTTPSISLNVLSSSTLSSNLSVTSLSASSVCFTAVTSSTVSSSLNITISSTPPTSLNVSPTVLTSLNVMSALLTSLNVTASSTPSLSSDVTSSILSTNFNVTTSLQDVNVAPIETLKLEPVKAYLCDPAIVTSCALVLTNRNATTVATSALEAVKVHTIQTAVHHQTTVSVNSNQQSTLCTCQNQEKLKGHETSLPRESITNRFDEGFTKQSECSLTMLTLTLQDGQFVSDSSQAAANISVSSVLNTFVSPGTRTLASTLVSPVTRISVSPVTRTSVSPLTIPSVTPAANTLFAPASSTLFSPVASTSVSPVASTLVSPAARTSVSPATRTSVSPLTVPSVSPAANTSFSPASSVLFSSVASTSISPAAMTSVLPATSISVSPVASTSVSPVLSMSVSPAAMTSVSPAARMSFSSASRMSVFLAARTSALPLESISVSPAARISVSPAASVSVSRSTSTSVSPVSNVSISLVSNISISPESKISISPVSVLPFLSTSAQLSSVQHVKQLAQFRAKQLSTVSVVSVSQTKNPCFVSSAHPYKSRRPIENAFSLPTSARLPNQSPLISADVSANVSASMNASVSVSANINASTSANASVSVNANINASMSVSVSAYARLLQQPQVTNTKLYVSKLGQSTPIQMNRVLHCPGPSQNILARPSIFPRHKLPLLPLPTRQNFYISELNVCEPNFSRQNVIRSNVANHIFNYNPYMRH